MRRNRFVIYIAMCVVYIIVFLACLAGAIVLCEWVLGL